MRINAQGNEMKANLQTPQAANLQTIDFSFSVPLIHSDLHFYNTYNTYNTEYFFYVLFYLVEDSPIMLSAM